MSLNQEATAKVNEHRATFSRISTDASMSSEEKAQGMLGVMGNLGKHFEDYRRLANDNAVKEIMAEFKEQVPAQDPAFEPVKTAIMQTEWVLTRPFTYGS